MTSDSYKWLFIPATAGLLIFLFLMHGSHPPAHITEIIREDVVSEESRLFLEKSGYRTEGLEPFAVFHSRDDLIHQQIAHFGKRQINDFIKHGFLRFIPSYYWEVQWIESVDQDTEDEEGVSMTMGAYRQPAGSSLYHTIHAPDGAVQQFHIEHENGRIRTADDDIPGTSSGSNNGNHTSNTDNFRNVYGEPEDFTEIDTGNLPVFTDMETGDLRSGSPEHDHLLRFLTGTVWDNHLMKVDSTYQYDYDDHAVTHIILSPKTDIFEHISRITVMMAPDGELHGIDQEVSISGHEMTDFNDPAGIIRVIFYTALILLLSTLFFRRLFNRLIDLRTATAYAVIATVLCFLHMIQFLFQALPFFTDGQILELITFLIILILFSGFVGVMVFIITGLGESICREIWPEKITSLSLIRLGYMKSKKIGRSLVTGVMAAMIYLGFASIMYALMDHSYLNPLDGHVFYSGSYLFPIWQPFINSIFWMFFISAGLFACFVSWIALIKNNRIFLLMCGAVAFALISSFYIETPGSAWVLLIILVPGFAVSWTFLKHDLLTLSTSMFLFVAAWSTIDGRLVISSPDSLLAWSVFIFFGLLFVVGFYLAEYGDEYEHIPELIPEYIREIAREQRVGRELEIARQVHQSFLPEKLPQLEGLDLAAHCQAAFDVGGDYYDVIAVDDHRMAFVIGDVSGKGIQAAFYMTMVKGIFQSLVKEIPEPIPLLIRMNRLFYDNARRGSFISICYGLLDVADGTLRYARAGHNPAVLIRARDRQINMLRSKGLAIGLTKEAAFEECLSEKIIRLESGDTLIFYTDGITEATNPEKKMFGDDRLITELKNNSHVNPGELLHKMGITISRFTAGTSINDDMTMVIVRYK